MIIYDCFFIDASGKLIGQQWIHASDDQEAIATARKLAAEQGAHRFELWLATKLIRAETIQLP